MSRQDQGTSPGGDRATQASPQAPSGLGQSASIPSALTFAQMIAVGANANAKSLHEECARMIAEGRNARGDDYQRCILLADLFRSLALATLKGAEAVLRHAQGIEAAAADETRSGSAVGESPVAKPCAQPEPQP